MSEVKQGLRLGVLFLVLAFGLVACGSKDEESEGNYILGEPLGQESGLVALVTSEFGGDTLTVAVFDQRIEQLTRLFPQVMSDPEQVPTVKAGIVDQFVMDHLLAGEARRRNLTVPQEQVDAEMAGFRQQFESDSAYLAALPWDSEEEAREQVERDLLPRLVLNAMMDEVKEPTENDIKEFAAEQAVQIRAQHILFLVPNTASDGERDTIREQAEAVLDSAKSGVDFSELARRHSGDPGSAMQGGDLGFFRRGDMVKPFEDAAFSLKETGDVSDDLVETTYGFHILRLMDRREQAVPESQAKELLNQRVRQKAQRDGVNRLKEGTTVRLNTSVVDDQLLIRK